MRLIVVGLLALVVAIGHPEAAAAQNITGQVISELNGAPAATALVRLLDRSEKVLDTALADSLGRFRLRVPEPGEFFIDAQHISYDYFRSPLLATSDTDRDFSFDLELKPAPIQLEGITVTAVQAGVDRWLRGRIGMRAVTLSHAPIMGVSIQTARLRNHTVVDLLRNNPVPGMTIMAPANGPCFQLRARGCATIVLDGARITREIVEAIPMDMIEAVLVLENNEVPMSWEIRGGVVLILTRGSVRARNANR